MPPSQLKQLKASLRDHGVLGPQKSKKQRKAQAKDAQKKLKRNAALESIRERFNPFEVKAPARRQKHEVISNRDVKKPTERPGVTRGLGEERRKETLLRELQSKNKIGGVVDRRFGENNPTLTPEQRAAERFARQNERKSRKNALFNLEIDSGDEMVLTHGGRSLDFEATVQDDYQQDAGDVDDASDFDAQDDRPRKRMRLENVDDNDSEEKEEEDAVPERKKTRKEVMEEIIAKSKMHKAERRAAKEDDEDLRMKLDSGISEMYDALRQHKPAEKPLPTPPSDSEPHMDPARAAMLAGKTREEAEQEYEANIRQMKMDARSKPSLRTKTEDEKAAEEAERLQELERQRVRRMKGEPESSEDEEEPTMEQEADEQDDAEAFGLYQPPVTHSRPELDVEDEDEFLLDDDLVASGSDVETDSDEEDSDPQNGDMFDDGDDDFINGLELPPDASKTKQTKLEASKDLAFTFPCPQTRDEFLEVIKNKPVNDLPTIVQRIRALYHKGLAQGNEEKLAQFAHVLIEHIVYMIDESLHGKLHFDVIENLLRHLHSMAKSQPQDVALAFRDHLSKMSDNRPLQLTIGDCILLTGISKIFPTSDQFHPVVTPALLTIARYLGQSSPQGIKDLCIGTFCCSLALQYQRLSKRYAPEVVNYIVNAIAILSPTALPETIEDEKGKVMPLNIAIRLPEVSLRIKSAKDTTVHKLSFERLASSDDQTPLGTSLLNGLITLAESASSLWSIHMALPEIIVPLIHSITHISSSVHQAHLPASVMTHASTTASKLRHQLSSSLSSRHPLLLHNHRPLPIKTSIPLFIDNYNPDRHYDPDRQRAELAKLKAEHKKERKGAMRELRKDANFMAREQLREKRERDEAYEKKMRRLVAEVQGEEGRESKEYEKEKRKRKAK